MADPKPLNSLDDMTEALMDGKGLYRVISVGGKPFKLIKLATLKGKENIGVLADHSCGVASTRSASPVELTPEGPQPAPATLGGPQAGNLPQHVLAGAQTAAQGFSSEMSSHPSRAEPVSPHRSRVPYVNVRCKQCNEMIGRTTNIIGVQIGERWAWVQHDKC